MEATIINKQLKKALPWEAPGNGNGVVAPSIGATQTCFFSPGEAAAFVKDFESTRRAYSDGLRHTTSDGGSGSGMDMIADTEVGAVTPCCRVGVLCRVEAPGCMQ